MGLENSRRNAHIAGIPLNYISLVTLAIQNAALILVMHYSRVMPPVDGHRYFASTAVFLNECMKLVIALGVALYDVHQVTDPNASMATLLRSVSGQVFSSDSWKLAIPAALYTFQNTLQYVAVSNLDAATFQVTYQLKILTTAMFSVVLLRRTLSVKSWVSLVLLMAGVAVVQLPTQASSGQPQAKQARGLAEDANMQRSVGLVAVVTACAISGLAGVYFEKVLKDSTQVSLWIRNLQMSFWSLFPALFIGVIFKDGAGIARDGFFAGYNWVVWTAITFQACGGLLVALVVNYADNIAKNFATSISIIVSCIASVWLFDFVPTANFVIGMVMVIYATYLYSSPDRRSPSSQSEYREVRTEDEESQDYQHSALGSAEAEKEGYGR